MPHDLGEQKRMMIEKHLLGRDIRDERVIQAMREVPREKFVPEEYGRAAYSDHPLPIGHGQTISQPYIVALMCQLLELEGDEKVLDIGTGSGYQTAILARLAREVIAVEIVPELAKRARETLDDLGCENVTVVEGDGKEGYAEEAPYQAIKSAAASKEIPEAWKEQLGEGGVIVLPLEERLQRLVRLTKEDGEFHREQFSYVRFVPLV